jgi:MFS family permease
MSMPPALQERDFRYLWFAGLLSDAGDWMLLIALPIVVYGLTGSALGTSVAFLAELVPGIVLAPFAGRLADRADRRRVMLVVTILQALSLLPLLLAGSDSGLAIVYAVIAVQASLATLFDPAKNALLPTLLHPEKLVSGNSLIALNSGVGRLVGGPLGGLLLAAGHLRVIVIADAISFVAAAALIAALPAPVATGATSAPGRPSDAGGADGRTSFIATLRSRTIRTPLLVTFIDQIAQGIFVVLFILFVAHELQGGSSEIGLLRGVQAVGAIAAGLALSFTRSPNLAGRMIAIGSLAFGLLDLTIWNAPPLTTGVGVYALLFVVAGAPGVVLETGLISYLQLAAGDHDRGRVFGAYTLVSNAGQGAGMLAAGLLTAPLGLMALLNAQGCLYLLGGALAALTVARAPRRRAIAPSAAV